MYVFHFHEKWQWLAVVFVGGGVMGSPGKLAAEAVLADVKQKKKSKGKEAK